MERNFWKMDGFSIFMDSYAYIDHKSYLADDLFAEEKVTVRFGKEMVKSGSPYCVIFCKIRKRDAKRFEKALDKLVDKMLLLGHSDYPVICDNIAKMVENSVKGSA